MAIQLDTPSTSTRPPVIGARAVGARCVGMVIDKEMRGRQDKDGQPILNSRGKPSQEEVLTVLVLEGTTGTISGGDFDDDSPAEVGSVGRFIFKGMDYGRLIDARKPVGATQVGDVIDFTANSATIWRGAADIAAKDVTDEAQIARARAKGLSIGFDKAVTYRRAEPAEAALVKRCEQLHMERREGITLDVKPVVYEDPYDAF